IASPLPRQRLPGGSLIQRARTGSEVWLDGGHNPGAGLVVSEAMADLEERVPRPLFLLVRMLNTHDPVGFLRPFGGLVRRVYTVPVPASNAGRDPSELVE